MTATTQNIAVAAYFGVNADWARIESAAGAVKLVVPDFSFSTLVGASLTNAQAQFERCRAQGQLVLGYVDTAFGQRSSADVNSDLNQWYASYPTQIDGIFFDDGPELDRSTDDFFKNYYIPLLKNFKATYTSLNIIMLNASGFPNDWIMQLADYVILWENTKDNYLDPRKYKAIGDGGNLVDIPNWWTSSQYTSCIVHVILGCSGSDLLGIANLSRSRNAGSGNCSTRLNDSFPIQDSTDRLVGIEPASCCRANDGPDGGEQISAPV